VQTSLFSSGSTAASGLRGDFSVFCSPTFSRDCITALVKYQVAKSFNEKLGLAERSSAERSEEETLPTLDNSTSLTKDVASATLQLRRK